MTVTIAQQQVLFALGSTLVTRNLPVPTLALSGDNLSLVLASPMERPFRITLDPDGDIVGLEAQSAHGAPTAEEPWTDILGSDSALDSRYEDFFRNTIAVALSDAEKADHGVTAPFIDYPASLFTSIPADAMEALDDPELALQVARTAALSGLVEDLAEMLYVVGLEDQAKQLPMMGCLHHSRALLTAIATTGSPFTVSFAGEPTGLRQGGYAAMLFTRHWMKR